MKAILFNRFNVKRMRRDRLMVGRRVARLRPLRQLSVEECREVEKRLRQEGKI
jgi:hypothetical protein